MIIYKIVKFLALYINMDIVQIFKFFIKIYLYVRQNNRENEGEV